MIRWTNEALRGERNPRFVMAAMLLQQRPGIGKRFQDIAWECFCALAKKYNY